MFASSVGGQRDSGGLNVLLGRQGFRGETERLFLPAEGADRLCCRRAGRPLSEELSPERGLACGNTSLRGVVAAVRRPELIETVARLREGLPRLARGNPRFRKSFSER